MKLVTGQRLAEFIEVLDIAAARACGRRAATATGSRTAQYPVRIDAIREHGCVGQLVRYTAVVKHELRWPVGLRKIP